MFNDTLVVQSAISTFNNVALRSPDFFWSALLCIPIFVIFWMLAPEISARFLPDLKRRRQIISTAAVAISSFWFLAHQCFDALRDGGSIGVSVLSTAIVFAVSIFAARRLFPISKIIKVKEKWRKRFDWIAPIAAAVVIGLCAWHTWQSFVLQASAAALGFGVGVLLNKLDKRDTDTDFTAIALMLVISFGLVMQPEFFRFGQLGNLTAVHILFLVAAVFTMISSIIMRITGPRGWLKNSWYTKITWLVRVSVLLVFVLFALTESALIFLALVLGIAVKVFITIRHRAPADMQTLKSAGDDLWIVSLALFGILTALPVLVCGAILLARARTKFNPVGIVKSLV